MDINDLTCWPLYVKGIIFSVYVEEEFTYRFREILTFTKTSDLILKNTMVLLENNKKKNLRQSTDKQEKENLFRSYKSDSGHHTCCLQFSSPALLPQQKLSVCEAKTWSLFSSFDNSDDAVSETRVRWP